MAGFRPGGESHAGRTPQAPVQHQPGPPTVVCGASRSPVLPPLRLAGSWMQAAALTSVVELRERWGRAAVSFSYRARRAIVMTTLTQCAFSAMLLLTLLISVWSHQHSRV